MRAFAVLALCIVGGCGGEKRQDANEPKGNFKVEVVRASFPLNQGLAKQSDLVITVRNPGTDTVPNVGVTVNGFDYRASGADLADPERPVFVIDGVAKNVGGFPDAQEAAPTGCATAYVNTWACGPLKAGKEHTFRWTVTAVKAGRFDISWRVAAGLNGKAKAVSANGGPAPRGSFAGTVSDRAPQTRVADDGKTVIEGTR